MPKTVKPLTAAQCDAQRFNPDGGNKLFDGGGLYLEVMSNGRKSWRMKYTRPSDGKEDRLVFGDYPVVTLKAARDERQKSKSLILQGIDPKALKKELARDLRLEGQITFESEAKNWHKSQSDKLKKITSNIIMRRFENFVFPRIGSTPIKNLTIDDLYSLLDFIVTQSTPGVAQRVQWSLMSVFRYSAEKKNIERSQVPDLEGYVKVPKGRHHPSLSFDKLPRFLSSIDNSDASLLTRLAIKLSLLTFIRSSELRLARWSEINWAQSLWVIPGERQEIEGVKNSGRGSKMGLQHYVPLSRQALEVLELLKDLTGRNELLFPSVLSQGKPMSENTINQALRRMGYDTRKDVCLHGFRSMACSALIQTEIWSEDAVERQMSHVELNGVRRSYTGTADFMQSRREMMQWWADYLDANRLQFVSPYDHVRQSKAIIKPTLHLA